MSSLRVDSRRQRSTLRHAKRTFSWGVFENPGLLQGHQALLDHLVENRDQAVDVVLRVDDLDDDGEVLRETQKNSESVAGVIGPRGRRTVPADSTASAAEIISIGLDSRIDSGV